MRNPSNIPHAIGVRGEGAEEIGETVGMPYQKYNEVRGIRSGTKPGPECTTDIPEGATRCPHCTAQLGTAPAV